MLKWSEYQERRISEEDYQRFFESGSLLINIGIVCGKVSRLLVVDIDSPQISEYLKEYIEEMKKETIVEESSPGKYHIYYRIKKYEKKIDEILVKYELKKKYEGLELKGDGQIITSYPSYHVAGHQYKIVSEHDIEKIKEYEGLEEFIEEVWKKIVSECIEPIKIEGIEIVPCVSGVLAMGVEEGERDETAFTIACYLREQGLEKEKVYEILRKWDLKNRPPLGANTIREKIESAYSKEYPFRCPKKKSSLLRGLCSYCIKSECILYGKKKIAKRIKEQLADEIEEVIAMTSKEDTIYEISIKGEKIVITADELLKQTKFRVEYFRKFGVALPRIKEGHWTEICNMIGKKIIEIRDEVVSEEDTIREIMEQIVSKPQTTEKCEELIHSYTNYYREGKLYVSNKMIKMLCTKYKLKIEEMRRLLHEYMVGNTKVIRVGKKTIRMWVFDYEKIERLLTGGEEGDE